MQELHALDNSKLLELLTKHTSEFTKMLTDNTMGDEYEKCKLTIKANQAEIDLRRFQVNDSA